MPRSAISSLAEGRQDTVTFPVTATEGHWRHSPHRRFKTNRSRFLHLKSAVKSTANEHSEQYMFPLVQKVMGIKIRDY